MENGDGASQWRESEVLDLISIWGDTSIQAKLEAYCNRSVFEKIVNEMKEQGHKGNVAAASEEGEEPES